MITINEIERKNRIIVLEDDICEAVNFDIQKKIAEINEEDESYIDKIKKVASDYGDFSEFKFEPPHIKLYLSTYGGSVYDGLGLYDIIKASKTPVDVYCNGKIMSMGIIVMLAAANRYAYKNTTFMIHEVSSGSIGKLDEMEESVEEAKRLNNILFSIITENTKIERTKLHEIKKLKKDWYFNAKEALKLGLVTKII